MSRPLSLAFMCLQVLHDTLPEQSKADASVPAAALLYCERFTEFLVDLLSQALRVHKLPRQSI